MRPAGSPRLIVANLASCSIGYLNRVGTVGEKRKPLTDADVFCMDWRGRSFGNVVTGEAKVMEAIEFFDSGALTAPSPALMLEAPLSVSPAAPLPPPASTTPMLPPKGKSSIVYSPHSARLQKLEAPNHMTILDKAILRKKIQARRTQDRSFRGPSACGEAHGVGG